MVPSESRSIHNWMFAAPRDWCFLEDREPNIWVGNQNGLNRFRYEKIATSTPGSGTAFSRMRTIPEARHSIGSLIRLGKAGT